MKIAILAAGKSLYFPFLFDKPKCLYHINGQVQLERAIETVKSVVDEKDIIVVGGYKAKHIKKYLIQYHPDIEFRINRKYKGPAIYSFRKAVENITEDVVITLADETISKRNIERICASARKIAILSHNNYYYYSLGIMKISKDCLRLLFDDKYLSMEYIKKIYCFANDKAEYDGTFNINSGICIGYIMIDIIRRVGKIEKIENPILAYMGEEIDFLPYNPKEEYIPDIDYYKDTDEYKNNAIGRFYSDYISDNILKIKWKISGLCRRIKKLVNKINKL